MNIIESTIQARLDQYGLTIQQLNKRAYKTERNKTLAAVITQTEIFTSGQYKQKYVRELLRHYGLKFSDEEYRAIQSPIHNLQTNKSLDSYKPTKLKYNDKPALRTIPLIQFNSAKAQFMYGFKLYILDTNAPDVKYKKLPKSKAILKLGSENIYTHKTEYALWTDELVSKKDALEGFAEYVDNGESDILDIVSGSDYKNTKFNPAMVVAIEWFKLMRAY